MNTLIMWVMACGAVLGGLDRILGNRFGLGKRFEEGFELLGATGSFHGRNHLPGAPSDPRP